jgi:hypothetical protein
MYSLDQPPPIANLRQQNNSDLRCVDELLVWSCNDSTPLFYLLQKQRLLNRKRCTTYSELKKLRPFYEDVQPLSGYTLSFSGLL